MNYSDHQETRARTSTFEINKDLCTGCGSCVSIAPEYITWDDDGKATMKGPVGSDGYATMEEAMRQCPTEAITEIG